MPKQGRMRVAFLLALGAVIFPISSALAESIYVQIPSIPGDSTDAAHPGWIVGYALNHQAASSGTGAASFADVSFLKGTDRATPLLHDALARGIVILPVLIDVCRQGPSGQECYYRIELSTVKVTVEELSGSSCIDPSSCTPNLVENVSLGFTRIKWTFTPFSGGKAGTPIEKCWDRPTNKAC